MTKRKIVGDTEQTEPPAKREKPAVTTDQPAAIKAIYQRNANTSPLLKLPGEIKVKIFSLVLGHQFIHLQYSQRRGKIRHTVCTASASEDEIYEQFVAGRAHLPSSNSAKYPDLTFRDRHTNCTTWHLDGRREKLYSYVYRLLSAYVPAEEPPKPMLDLSLLRVCRQVYEEASYILRTTNTFSFGNDTTLVAFIHSFPLTQRQQLRRLHFDFTWDDLAKGRLVPSPPDFIPGNFISRLGGLRTFHVTLDPVGRLSERELLDMLYEMRRLPLQHVTIVICDSKYHGGHGWAITERREIAKNVRSNLLDPNTPGHLVAKRLAEKEAQAELRTAERKAREAWYEERTAERKAKEPTIQSLVRKWDE